MKTQYLAIALFLAIGPGLAHATNVEEGKIAKLEALVSKDRENARALNDLGTLYLDANRLDDAESRFREALAVPPAYTIGPFLFGDIYSDAERYQAAIDDYRRIIDQNAEYARARNYLGRVFLAKNQTASARREFEEALRINPEYTEAQENLRHALASPQPSAAASEEASRMMRKKAMHTADLSCKTANFSSPARCGLREHSPLPSGEPARAFLNGEPEAPRFRVRQASREATPVQAAPSHSASVEFPASPPEPAEGTEPAASASKETAVETMDAPQQTQPAEEAPAVKVLKVGAAQPPAGESSGLPSAPASPEETAPGTASAIEEAHWDENTQEPSPMSEWLFQYPK